MSEETKAKLREVSEKRREENKLKRLVRANSSRLVDEKKEETIMKKKSKKTKASKSGIIFGFPAVSKVVHWMGKEGFSLKEAKAGLKKAGASKTPSDAHLNLCLRNGKAGHEPAALTAEQQKILRDAAKAIEIEKKAEKAEKKEAAAA